MKRKYSESSGYQSGKRQKLSHERDKQSALTLRSQVIPNPKLSQSLKLGHSRQRYHNNHHHRHYNNKLNNNDNKENTAENQRLKIDEAPKIGTVIENRYRIDKFLGKGSFGFVCSCSDLRVENLRVAIKFLKYLDEDQTTLREIKTLQKIAEVDTKGEYHCIQPVDLFKDSVSTQDCLVFPLLSCNLYEWLKSQNYRPFTISESRIIFKQLCHAIAFIHSLHIIHTDIKPENIMIVDDKKREIIDSGDRLRCLDIKIIDFGMAVDGGGTGQRHHCQTRHYRAPEVLLKQQWSYGIDLWSMGCVLYELITGDTIFMPSNVNEHLFLIKQFLGDIPLSVVDRSSRDIRRKYFHRDGTLRVADRDGGESDLRPLRKLGKYRKYNVVVDLVKRMLRVDPSRRISARDALRHDFLN